jgi:serine/threonine protein kinase
VTNDPGEDPTGSRSDVPLAGRCVGNSYVLVKPIGQGATGTVWRGEDRSTGEPVAIKLLHDSLLRQPRLVTRFVQERTILQMLRHRHVVRVRDLFSVGETLGLVMDLVAGGNLRDHLHRSGTVAPGEAVRLAGQVASALAEAHGLGIIHRDLKPDNILIRSEAGELETRLTDFGIARMLNLPSMTTPNAVVGTPHYMAPEAFHGVTPSPATDVYALGVLLYELITGHPPYRSDSIPELMRLHAEGQPHRRPGIPDPLWRIITMCLAGKPRNRPTATELVTDLGFLVRNLADTPALSRPGSPPSESLVFEPRPSVLPGPLVPAPRRRRFRNNAAPANRWSRPGAIVVAGTVLASGIATTAWHLGRSGGTPAEVPAIIAMPSAPTSPVVLRGKPVASAAASQPPSARKIAAPSRKPSAALPGKASARPKAGVRAKHPASSPRGGARVPMPEGKAQGRWQCTPRLVFDLRTRTPLSPRPCHQVGRDIQFQAALTAPSRGRGRIEVALQDARTGRTVAGPRTCDGLSFSRSSMTQECGPLVAEPRRGRQYAVVMTFRFVRSDGRSSTSTTKGRPFTW